QWVEFGLDWTPEEPRNAFIVIRANRQVAVHRSAIALPCIPFHRHREPSPNEPYLKQWRYWKYTLHRESLCFRVGHPTNAYSADHVLGGYARPYGGPQMWVSEPLEWDKQPYVQLDWSEPVTFREVALIFDDAVEEDLINLHHHRTPFDVMPELARDYRVEAVVDGQWRQLCAERDNRRRHRVHPLAEP